MATDKYQAATEFSTRDDRNVDTDDLEERSKTARVSGFTNSIADRQRWIRCGPFHRFLPSVCCTSAPPARVAAVALEDSWTVVP